MNEQKKIEEIIARVVKEAKEASASKGTTASKEAFVSNGTSAASAAGRMPARMTLAIANELIEKVSQKAKSLNARVVMAVVDAGGNPVAVQRMDDAYIASYDIALNKAYTSVSLKMSTKTLATLAGPGGSLYGIQYTNGGRIVIFGGGVPLRSKGEIIGGFGVSGGSAKEDTELGDYAEAVFKTLVP